MHVLLDHQNGQAAVAQLGNHLEDLVLVAGDRRARARRAGEAWGRPPAPSRFRGDLLFAAAQIAGQHAELGRAAGNSVKTTLSIACR